MDQRDNRAIVTAVMDALATGDTRPFAEAMADDFAWHMMGTTPWSGSFVGKDVVRGRLMRTLFAQFATPYTNRASRIMADGDMVVVECAGAVTTTGGKAYNNTYCYVIRMAGGQMRELTEYMDTALVSAVLEPPVWS